MSRYIEEGEGEVLRGETSMKRLNDTNRYKNSTPTA